MKPSAAAVASSPSPLTLEDWGDLDEDVEGELVDGTLEEEEVATFLHELAVSWLFALLHLWARPRGGFVTGSGTKVAISPHRGRKPDISVFIGGVRPRLDDSVVRVAPHIVIEVISPRPRDARRDRVDKIGDYAKAKVRNYWILDPQIRSLELFQLGPRGRYVHARAATSGRIVDVPGCDGLIIDLDDLWREIEEAAAPTPAPRTTRPKPRPAAPRSKRSR